MEIVVQQRLTYRDAVDLLGGASRLTNLLDNVSSLALLGLGAIDLFDARAEVIKLGDRLILSLRDRLKRLYRYDRTQRLAAAHAVIVMSAYFKALAESSVVPQGELSRDDQEQLLGQDHSVHWVEKLIEADLPIPTPQRPYEDVVADLERLYRTFSSELLRLIAGLAFWDKWDETYKVRMQKVMLDEVPQRGCRRYAELFRQLAGDFPEVAYWADLNEHQATRSQVRELKQSLAGLEKQLEKITSGREPSDKLSELVRGNKAALNRPIISTSEIPLGMAIPPLHLAYVNPTFRLLKSEQNRHPSDESSWDDSPVRDDLNEFLLAHLTLPHAVRAPLLILGQPGAGKSMLTKMLAARLPASDFQPIRVELRNVPADSGVLEQIEYAIKDALDEPMSWPELVHAAQGALPVVMLDGFDELLQATGVTQTDYLEKVAEFQQRQAERGRALIVLVTSRTAVADRARVPGDAVVLRLEPFNNEQVHRWGTVWNHANNAYFADRGLRPFSTEDVLTVPDLARQPLLLLMLALYDADSNDLHRALNRLNEAELYEQLLLRFTRREVRKLHVGISDADLEVALEQNLLRLSITAFAMFNRGRQWVSEDNVDDDLNRLLDPQSPERDSYGFRRRLTPAENVIGGFFFIHRAQALRDTKRLNTYEFLHATFGEYLIARLVARELKDLAAELAAAGTRTRPTRPDNAFLHALLSFSVLTSRSSIVGFLRHGIEHRISAARRANLRSYLYELFAQSLRVKPSPAYDTYRPASTTVPARYAAYSANLLLLCALICDQPISGTDLFCTDSAEEAANDWQRITRFWRSQLTREEWNSLIQTVRARHFLHENTRLMTVQLDHGEDFHVADLPCFTWPLGVLNSNGRAIDPDNRGADYDLTVNSDDDLGVLMRRITFEDDQNLGALFLSLVPYARSINKAIGAHYVSSGVGSVVPAYELLELLLTPYAASRCRRSTYIRAFSAASHMRGEEEAEGSGERYGDLIMRQLEEDSAKMPTPDLVAILDTCLRQVTQNEYRKRITRNILQGIRRRADLDLGLYNRILQRSRV